MIRKIIEINADRCDGCGICAEACHEGAIGMRDGKAVLLRDDYCDGLGDCLPACPQGAITFVEREADAYDEAAVKANMAAKEKGCPGSRTQHFEKTPDALPCGCAGTHVKNIERLPTAPSEAASAPESQLQQWPVQIKLVPVNAPYFQNANLLIAADCTAFSVGDFHARFMKNRITLIGCPKLDEGDYAEKLTEILKSNSIKSVTVVRMQVPCCGGLSNAVITALKNCGKTIPWQVATVSIKGELIED